MRSRASAALVTAALAVAASSALAEDVVSLLDGTTIRGVLRSRDAEEVVIVCDGREVRVPASQVAFVGHVVQPADAALVARLAAADASERAAAAEEIVRRWPDSAATLDAALAHPVVRARLEAAMLLGRTEIADVADRVRRAMADEDAGVRGAAVRVVRHRRLAGFEDELARRLSTDVSAVVSLECLRTLEDVGTVACLRAVLADWTASRDEGRRRRCLRVLRRITGEDHRDDVDAWRDAVERAVRAATPPSPVPAR